MAQATGAKNQAEQARHEASSAANKAQDALGQAGQAASTAVGAVGQKAGELAGQAGQRISEAASAAGGYVNEAAGAAGRGAQSLADTVRQRGPQEGYLGQATKAVAGGLEQAGQYVSDKQLTGMADDIGGMIKAHPIPAVLIGLGVGFLLGRALRD